MVVMWLCHYGGSISTNNDSGEYVGGSSIVFMTQTDMTICELKQNVYSACQWNDREVDVELYWRMLVSDNPRYFELVPIHSSSTLEAMFHVVKQGLVKCLEIFVDSRANPRVPTASTHERGIRVASKNHIVCNEAHAQTSVSQLNSETVGTSTSFQRSSNLSSIVENVSRDDGFIFDGVVANNDNDSVEEESDCSINDHMIETSNKDKVPVLTSFVKPNASCISKAVCNPHQLTVSFVANIIFPLVKADLGLKIKVIMDLVFDRFGYEISYTKAWHAKQKVLEQLFGTHEAVFSRLPRLMSAFQQSNPGTVVEFKYKKIENGEATFDMVFWAFGAAIEGFQHCRPLISIDRTHLNGKYRGKLLIGVAYDANNQLFPLCYAIVDNESKHTWIFFLECLKQHVTRDRMGICIVSDCHQDIKHGVNLVFPEPFGFHRFCSRHLASNFNKEFKNTTIGAQLKTMAGNPNKWQFDVWYEQFCKLGTDGDYKRWIKATPKEKWALAYDDGHRYGVMTTNSLEVFNGILKGARGLPVTSLILLTFYRENEYFVRKRAEGQVLLENVHTWPFYVATKISHAMTNALCCRATLLNLQTGSFRVDVMHDITALGSLVPDCYIVNVSEKSCSCGEWQLFSLPCPHLMSACKLRNLDYTQFVSSYFRLEAYLKAYAPTFHPLPDELFWSKYNGPKLVADSSKFIIKSG